MLEKKEQKYQKQVVINFLNIETIDEIIDLTTKVIEECFEVENLNNKNFCIYVTFTNSTEIKRINRKHRKIDKETDVLSFPLFQQNELKDILGGNTFPKYMLGDIVISLDKAKQQSKEYEHSLEREIGFLLVHGFYHLLGYDHINETEEKIMIQKQEHILNQLKLQRMYGSNCHSKLNSNVVTNESKKEQKT